MNMNDRIQLDGKTYVPLAASFELTGMSEALVQKAAENGHVWLRAAGKKVYVELESLRKLAESQAPVIEQPIPRSTRTADVPSYVAPTPVSNSSVVREPAKATLVRALPANVPASTPRKSVIMAGILSALVLGAGIAGVANIPALGKAVAYVGSHFRFLPISQSAAVGASELGGAATTAASATTSPTYSVTSPQLLTASTDSLTSLQPIYYVYNYPVIERVRYEVSNISATSTADFSRQLLELYNTIQSQIQALGQNMGTQTTNVYNSVASIARIDHLDNLDLTNPTIRGGTISGVSFSASELSGVVDVENGGTGISSYSVGDLLYASAAGTLSSLNIGTTGQVLKITGGIPTWGDITGGTSALFATTSDSLAIHPVTLSNVLLLGADATTTTGNIFEVFGNSLLRGALTAYNNVTAAYFTATSTMASTFPYASSTAFTVSGTGYFGTASSTNLNATYASTTAITSSGSAYFATSGGSVGVGTTTPFRKFSVSDTVSTAQAVVAYDGTRYAELRVDTSGDLNIGASGGDTFLNNDNFWVCTGGSIGTNGCPSGAPTGQGNVIVENKVGIGTSTPAYKLSIETQDATTNFFQIASSTAQSIFVVTKDGKVGAGTTTPSAQLAASGLLYVGAYGATGLGTATSTFQGDIKITGKLDVGTIDPVYTIDGVKYATYGSAQVGIKEEVSFKATLSQWDAKKKMYVYAIDFNKLEKGSDLWLFYQVTDFGKYWENLIVTLAPGFDGRVYYEESPQKGALNIYMRPSKAPYPSVSSPTASTSRSGQISAPTRMATRAARTSSRRSRYLSGRTS